MTLWHWLYVALHSGHPLLGFLHDSVEEGYRPKALLRYWPALDAITRRNGETYHDYIYRVSRNKKATRVKLTDLQHNLTRGGGPPGNLKTRYENAVVHLKSIKRVG